MRACDKTSPPQRRLTIYDTWLFAGDSGQFFVHGTTKRVAEMIQRSIAVLAEKDVDTGLVEALTAASNAKPKRDQRA